MNCYHRGAWEIAWIVWKKLSQSNGLCAWRSNGKLRWLWPMFTTLLQILRSPCTSISNLQISFWMIPTELNWLILGSWSRWESWSQEGWRKFWEQMVSFSFSLSYSNYTKTKQNKTLSQDTFAPSTYKLVSSQKRPISTLLVWFWPSYSQGRRLFLSMKSVVSTCTWLNGYETG